MSGHRSLATLFLTLVLLTPGWAQQPLPRPGQGGAPPPPAAGEKKLPRPSQAQPPTAPAPKGPPPQQAAPTVAPAKPYKIVPVTLPQTSTDASLAAFRKQLADLAKRKDRAALSRLVAKDFFWLKPPEGEDGADRKKPGIDNLAAALGLNARDGSGWETLGLFAEDDTEMPMPDRKGVVCSPADPQFDGDELEALGKATGTDPGEWGYTLAAGEEVYSKPDAKAPVIEKLGLHFVRVMPDMSQNPDQDSDFVRIVTPSGKVGYLKDESLSPLGNDQLCFVKDAAGWRIVGFIGGQE